MKLTERRSFLDAGLLYRKNTTAVRFLTGELTYNQLSSLTSLVAEDINALTEVTQGIVVVLTRKNIYSVVSMLSVFLSPKMIFAPLDASMPILRIKNILTKINPILIMGESDLLDKLDDVHVKKYTFEQIEDLLSSTLLETKVVGRNNTPYFESPEDISYIIHTSGSTGEPKGVQIQKKSLLSFFSSIQSFMFVTSESRCMSLSPLHFDACVVDLLYPLWAGAEITLTPDILIPKDILNRITKYKITHFAMIMPTLTMVSKSGLLSKYDLSSIKYMMTGAEVLNREVINDWLDNARNATIVNGYGPTEATCVCLGYLIHKKIKENTSIPIGYPLDGTNAALINSEGSLINDCNIIGELIIGGKQLMLGYLRRADLDKDKFITINNQRFYKSGDLAYKDSSGLYYCLGRVDEEVKIRGYRIHPNEVSHTILQNHNIKEAFVFKIDNNGESNLVAVISVKCQENASEQFCRSIMEELRKILPSYMIPSYLYVQEALPKLSNGKLDSQRIKSAVAFSVKDNKKIGVI